MSTESVPARKSRPQDGSRTAPAADTPLSSGPVRFLDGITLVAFLALTFLLGIFPLKDTDFWWHLRTGDLIRQTGRIPTTDLYTFGASDHPWIDLHWVFQVALSWGFAHGGVVTLNLAKCVITCAAVLLLVTARRRDWPLWITLLAWLPALLLLGGRMYVRPETLTLLFLSAYLAVLFRWEQRPALALALPLIQVVWVNTQGLFVLGPVVLTFALIHAALRPSAFAASRARWWRTIGLATLLVGAACVVNPYGLRGALYPLELARTMDTPIFWKNIAELSPIDLYIARKGSWNDPLLLLHLATMLLGALSFLIPLVWTVFVRALDRRAGRTLAAEVPNAASRKKSRSKARRKTASASDIAPAVTSGWSLSVFRLLLYVAFSYLSWRATRNSHQFAAVVGAVIAWNFAEWGAAIRQRRVMLAPAPLGVRVWPRVATLTCIVLLFASVASGRFYAFTGEGRTIGLGEESLWYPHEAVKFAGRPGMPERFVGFHDGYPALYEYYNGPKRKVFADARLEVMGPTVYEQYMNLKRQLTYDQPGWERELDAMGRPAVLCGHFNNAVEGATLMASPHWRCVWFDPIAAVFVHESYTGVVRSHTVDFAARHYRPDPSVEPRGTDALLAMAKALWTYASQEQYRHRGDLARPLALLGLEYARRLRDADPDAAAGWKVIGQLERAREVPSEVAVARFRRPLDPVFDLTSFRATYALRRAHAAAPEDFMTLFMLTNEYEMRAMDEAALPLLEQLVRLHPINPDQRMIQKAQEANIERIRARLGTLPSLRWENTSELDRIVTSLLAAGRARAAADLLERSYPQKSRPWEVSDRIATLRLHLGEPARARTVWQDATAPPTAAVRTARVALTYLVEGAFDDARRLYEESLRSDPKLFEACHGLATLEQDVGHAPEAVAAARKAVASAPNDISQAAAQMIASDAAPYAKPQRR